ncbi:MAG: AAA family ATPase [Promethearchaeia archaeon]
MQFNSVQIKNIRSIKNLEITFPLGTILFHGDIGSGKSSVLKAVEFCLFGILRSADLAGASILRRGERKGRVTLSFSIGNEDYIVRRTLKRHGKDSVRDEGGWLVQEGTKTSYSARDLKSKILSLLNYSISKWKHKQSLDIFRYTVYTPQENVKQILQADPDDRFEALKDVLEIEKYENTLNHLDDVKTELNSRVSQKEAELKALGIPKKEIPEKKKEIEVKRKEIKAHEKQISEIKKELKSSKEKRDKKQEELKEYSNKVTEITGKQKQNKESKKNIATKRQKLKKKSNQIEHTKQKLRELPEIELKTDKSKQTLEDSLKKMRKSLSAKEEEKGKLKKDKESIESLLEKGICPRCKQKIHEKERFDTELEEAAQSIEKLELERKNLQEDINRTEQLIENIQKYKGNTKERKGLQNLLTEQETSQKEIKSQIAQLEKEVKKRDQMIQDIMDTYEIKDFKKFQQLEEELSDDLKTLKKEVEELQSNLTDAEKAKSTAEAELKQLQNELTELKRALKRKKEIKEEIKYIGQVRDWVSEQFPVLLRDIERSILAATADKFNKYFKQWFRAMVEEENIEISINPENFEPIIKVNGYTSPFQDLSGGEKSALSLAYRLALNKIINTKHEDIKTRDLLVLDEPTDGFSQEQVNKMQDIFGKLDTEQMIIISHERNLDSFVTDIFHFRKENHKTKVTREQNLGLSA